jgi:uncharacterized protein (DUF2235 family)
MKRLLLIGAWLLLSAFGPAPRIFDPLTAPGAPPPPPGPCTLLVFMDGTSNNPATNTNVYKLFTAVVADRTKTGARDTAAFYIEGVGTGLRFIGAATGWGLSYRVRQAHAWLMQTWRPDDRIVIFGFSRGAFSARALAGMLEYAGLPAEPVTDRRQAQAMADALFAAVKQDGAPAAQRRESVLETLKRNHFPPLKPHVPVAFMGLWDTVEAMGNPLAGRNPYDLPNANYGDQLCNVAKAAHALSADDNRNRSYRPVLLTGAHLLADCPDAGDIDARVSEVWFTGAHSDVGGKETKKYAGWKLGGVALNWMLAEAAPLQLFGDITPFPQDPLAISGNGQAAFSDLKAMSRTLAIQQRIVDGLYLAGYIAVHQSVIDNLKARQRQPYEFDWAATFPKCFDRTGPTAIFREQPGCRIRRVNTPPAQP